MQKERNLLDVLLNEDNKENITFFDDGGEPVEFKQVAVIPYKVANELKLYCLLSPISKTQGVDEDEVIVFSVEDPYDKPFLKAEQNDEIATAVYNEYVRLVMGDE